tara:strand:- start:11416 stop:12015 length:600 start_codon:yes stop_codon:yes gene_type:complete
MLDVTGIILIGGRSTRMGSNKALLPVNGSTLLQYCVTAISGVVDEIVVVNAPDRAIPEIESNIPLVFGEDRLLDEGPLVGIAAGLELSRAPTSIVTAVDMPLIRSELLELLIEKVDNNHQWVVPIAEGRPQPLCSALLTNSLSIINAKILEGVRAPMALSGDLNAYRLKEEEWQEVDPNGQSFKNINTPEEFSSFLNLF